MRKYSNRELKCMSQEEGEELIKKCLIEFEKLGIQIQGILDSSDNSQDDEKTKDNDE